MMVENDCREYMNIYSPVDNACHGFDLDCVAKAGKDILGDGARIAGNGDELYIFPLKTKNHIMQESKIILKIKSSISRSWKHWLWLRLPGL